MSDCTPKHPFVDLAPAFEESPDWLSALSILHAAVLCGVVRPNQPHVMVRRQANAQIHGPPQTEPSPQGLLLGRSQCNQLRIYFVSDSWVLNRD